MRKISYPLKDKIIYLIQGDITKADVDVIVNAANSSLMGGGGVDGAIHRAAGPGLLDACKKIREEKGKLPTGEAVITPGFDLKARYVIHTVGPIWRGGNNNERDLLESAYRNSLLLAEKNRLTSIAFPAISCGAYGFPVEEASKIAMKTIRNELKRCNWIKEVFFYLFGDSDWDTWSKTSEEILKL